MTNPRSAADLLIRSLAADRRPTTEDCEPDAVWDEVVDTAVRERVTPLLFKRLKDSDARARVPTDAWKRLRRAYFNSGDRNTRLYRELSTVLRGLHSSGIKVIALKGAFLAEAVYGDVALRPMCDNDLMVPRAELARAQAVLLDMGGVYLKRRVAAASGPGAEVEVIEPGFGAANHAPPIVIRDLAVELHWTILSPTGPVRVEPAGLWDRARPAVTAGVKVLSLSPEDLLLHLCLHFSFHHHFMGLRYLCDIAETVRRFRDELGWAEVTERAREWGASRHVGLALRLAGSMLDAGMPDDVLERLVPEGLDPKVFEAARETVITGTSYDKWLSPAYLGLRERGPVAHKVKLLWERVFLPRDAMLVEYPESRNSRHLYRFHARRIKYVMRKWAPALRMMLGHEWGRSLSKNTSLDDWLRSGRR